MKSFKKQIRHSVGKHEKFNLISVLQPVRAEPYLREDNAGLHLWVRNIIKTPLEAEKGHDLNATI